MCKPDITTAEREAVLGVLDTPTLALGPRLELFERRLGDYIGAPHAVGVSSGTAGLHLCMIAAGVGDGDLVLTTPFSFVASANCVLYRGARPVFVDIDPDTLTIDPEALERAADTLSPRVKAILPVYVFAGSWRLKPWSCSAKLGSGGAALRS
jgi:perosamine synthetase